MNYNEALAKKNEIGDFIQYEGLIMKVFVCPEKEDDFKKFVGDYRVMKFTDKSCLNYSTNNKFKIAFFWTDGINVLYKFNELNK